MDIPPFLISHTNYYDLKCGGRALWCYAATCPICHKENRVAYVQAKELKECYSDLCGHLKPVPNRRGDFTYSAKFGDSLRWSVEENCEKNPI